MKMLFEKTLVAVGTRYLALALVIASLVPTVPAAPVEVTAGSVRGFHSTTVSVPIFFNADTNTPLNVVALQADVVYDATHLTPANTIRGAAVPSQTVQISDATPGVRRIVVYSLSHTLLTNGVLVEVEFTVGALPLPTKLGISVTNVLLATAAAGSVPSVAFSGAVVIVPVFFNPNRSVAALLNVTPNRNYIIQATTNFVFWQNILTNTPASSVLEFADPAASTFRRRYYRAVSTP